MRFFVLSEERGRAILDLIDPAQAQNPDISSFQGTAGAGDFIEAKLFHELTTAIDELKAKHGASHIEFDAHASVLIHQLLPNEAELTCNEGFWRWLALGPLREATKWRFPAKARKNPDGELGDAMFNRNNFGVGSTARQRAECYPYKLWLRGELGFVAGADPYRFARRGDVDFWTSHIHRQSYTTNRNLCAAMVRFQYPDALDGKPLLLPGEENASAGKLGVRTLAKRVRRMQATYELSVLDDVALSDLISKQAGGLTRMT